MSFKLEDKEREIGATLHCYASGDGSLSFVYSSYLEDTKNQATGDKVTRRDVEYFIKHRRPELLSWTMILMHGDQYKLFERVTRTAPDEVEYKNRSYRYVKLSTQHFTILDSEGHEIRNLDIMGAIMFYVNNERECDDALRS